MTPLPSEFLIANEDHAFECAAFNEESPVEHSSDLAWLDAAWEDFIFEDLACEYETQYDKELEKPRPGRNLQPAHTLPNPSTLEIRFQEEASLLSTTPLNALNLNAALLFPLDKFTRYSNIVDGDVDAPHNEGGRHHCVKCNRPFKLEKDLRRHVKTAKAHRPAVFQCCCTHTSGRKDNFLKHIERKKPCNPTVPFICSCGLQIESNSPDAITMLLKHIKPCGQGRRGRPKK